MTQTTTERTASSISSVLISRIVQHHQHWRNALTGFLQQVLQIQQGGFIGTLVDEGGRHSSFTTATRSPDSVNVILNFRGHVEINDVLNIGEIQTLGRNISCD